MIGRKIFFGMRKWPCIGRRPHVSGSYEMFDAKMRAQALERLRLEADLRHAVERGEFENFYQPVVCLETGRTKGFEALVRWNHPTQGLVYPADFISLAEETGLIIPLGEWVLREACLQMSLWRQQFPKCFPLNMSVNLSGRQIQRTDLVEMVKRTLWDSGLPPDLLNLEITESILMENTDSSIMKLSHLREMGVQLSIDDFGTGYSSLSYLHRFPVGTLKIDRSFIHEIGPETRKLEFVRTIVSLAHHLNLNVVAEGVEEALQAEQLRMQGCEFGQGYYFSRPITRQATMDLLSQEAKQVQKNAAREPSKRLPILSTVSFECYSCNKLRNISRLAGSMPGKMVIEESIDMQAFFKEALYRPYPLLEIRSTVQDYSIPGSRDFFDPFPVP